MSELKAYKPFVVWFMGLPSSGKSTLAKAMEDYLCFIGRLTCVLDGDNIRKGLCGDLQFSLKDRRENIRRIAEVAKLFTSIEVVPIVACITPLGEHREQVREIVGPENLIEIFCDCPPEVCEKRNVGDSYGRVKRGEIKNFVNAVSLYEIPFDAGVTLNTDKTSVEDCIKICSTLWQEYATPT